MLEIIVSFALMFFTFIFAIRKQVILFLEKYESILSSFNAKKITKWHTPNDHKWYTRFDNINPVFDWKFYLFIFFVFNVCMYLICGVILRATCPELSTEFYDLLILIVIVISAILFKLRLALWISSLKKGEHILATY